MRLYAPVLGTLLTAGSAYLAQLAISSSGFERAWKVLHPHADPVALDLLWYGGVLDPITIETTLPAPSLTAKEPEPGQHEQCPLPHPKYQFITSDNARPRAGATM